jgi:uncharacterized protein YdaU (DUF1376 family)
LHYYQFNIGDYHSHTGYLSLLEDLAYRRLLDAYYLSESPYPEDPKQVARLVGMRDNVDEVTQILNDFFTLKDGFWINKRVDAELELYHSKAVTARNNGRKGGRPPKDKETQGEPNPNPEITQSVNLANPEITGSQANHKPLTKVTKGRFAPPSLNEAKDYFTERQSTDPINQAEGFIDFYESKGWMVGKNKMKDWKAAIRNWIKRSSGGGQSATAPDNRGLIEKHTDKTWRIGLGGDA